MGDTDTSDTQNTAATAAQSKPTAQGKGWFGRLEAYFEDPYRAISWLKILIIVWAVGYVTWQVKRDGIVLPWECRRPIEKGYSACESNDSAQRENLIKYRQHDQYIYGIKYRKHDQYIYGAVNLGSNGPLDIQIRYDSLNSYLPNSEIEKIQVNIQRQVAASLPSIMSDRKAVLFDTRITALDYGSKRTPPLYFFRAYKGTEGN